MELIWQGIVKAVELVFGLDAEIWEITWLSLKISGSATLISLLLGVPLGIALALIRFRGRNATVALINTGMGLPPVVVGLFISIFLWRSGPLGFMELIYSPTAMVIAQAILVTPSIAGLSRQVLEDAWHEYEEQLRSLGATPTAAAATLLWDTRYSLVTVVLAGFGRAAAEVGAVIIVGGNIEGVTRVMTTAISLETSKGDLPLALGLGLILVAVVFLINAAAQIIKTAAVRRYG